MRILLYILMQIAVLVVVSIVGSIIFSLFGISMSGSSYTGLLVMCAIFGSTLPGDGNLRTPRAARCR